MRITAFMLFNQFYSSLNRNLSKLSLAQEQLSSGKKLTKPSDDIIAARGTMSYKISIDKIGQYNRNIDEGIVTLGKTENQLSYTNNLINRARELAISESSATATAGTRNVTSYEVQNLFDELLDIGNTKIKDKYLFSGFLTGTQPFNTSGSYLGDTGNLEIFIANGIKTGINLTGDTAFFDTTKQLSAVLGSTAGMGMLRITSGSNNPVTIPIKDTATNASPEEVRDAINAPMSGYYDVTDTIGTGTLSLKAGTGSSVSLTVDATNNTPALLRDAINTLNMGIEARLATDTVSGEVRLFFRPTTAGTPISIDVSGDGDGVNNDLSGLSALLHTDLKSNLSTNALGIEAFVINDTAGKRMLFDSTTSSTSFTIEVDENVNGSFADAADTDTTGLSRIYHDPSASSNLTASISFFTVMDHFKNSLENNDTAGIQGSIHLFDGVLDSIVNSTADVGSRLNYLDNQRERLLDSETQYQQNRSLLEDTDITKAAMELTRIQTSLEAMRISSVQGLTQSLFDFLK